MTLQTSGFHPNHRIALFYKLKVARPLFSFANEQITGCPITGREQKFSAGWFKYRTRGHVPFLQWGPAWLEVIAGRPGEGGPNFKAGCLLPCIKQTSNISALINFLHAHYALGLTELSWDVLSHLGQQASVPHMILENARWC